MNIQGSTDVCTAAKESGLNTNFVSKSASFGAGGKFSGNLERDFLRDAKTRLGTEFHLAMVPNIVKDSLNITRSMDIGVLLPHEVCHLVYATNPGKFNELFPADRISKFWLRTIEDDPLWFREHPAYEAIRSADGLAGLARYLPLHLFGDDGCLKKTRAFGCITWFCAVHSKLTAVESRVPFYCVPRHILLPDYTENELQKVLVWSFVTWASGRFPAHDWKGDPWPAGSWRSKMATNGTAIAGHHVGIYTGTVCDQLWAKQHYRFQQLWSAEDSCFRCGAIQGPGPLNYFNMGPFPARCCVTYLESTAGLSSPLSQMPGFGLYSLVGEAMHAGPLGCLMDIVASALVSMCFADIFGDFPTATIWQEKLQLQLNDAFAEFSAWADSSGQDHTIRRFGRAAFSMKTLSSWPMWKGKAHNCLVFTRWLENKLFQVKDSLALGTLQWHLLWGWTEWFCVCMEGDPDFLEPAEILRLDKATRLMILGHKRLANACEAASVWRYKTRPKIHIFYHLLVDVKETRRNPRAWWSFKEEEFMGRVAKIASEVHAVTLSNRTLERWCVQFFSSMTD